MRFLGPGLGLKDHVYYGCGYSLSYPCIHLLIVDIGTSFLNDEAPGNLGPLRQGQRQQLLMTLEVAQFTPSILPPA